MQKDIIAQIGGNKFFAMTGCKAYTRPDGVKFTIPRNATSANRLYVSYDEGQDLYNMRFYRETGGKFNMKTGDWIERKEKTLAEFCGVYCDMLRDIFTEITGMHTSLGTCGM